MTRRTSTLLCTLLLAGVGLSAWALFAEPKADARAPGLHRAHDRAPHGTAPWAVNLSDRLPAAGQRLAAGGDGTLPPGADAADFVALLDRVRDAVGAGDGEAFAALASSWFADGPAGVEALLVASTQAGGGPDTGLALGALLRAAVCFTEVDPGRMDGWGLGELVEATTALLGSGDAVPEMMRVGLGEHGARLEPDRLVTLIGAYGAVDVGPPSSQIACLALAKAWARDMGPGVVDALSAAIVDTDAGGGRPAQAARMLLGRDWRAGVQPALAALGQLQPGPARTDVAHALGSQIRHTGPEEAAGFFQSVSRDEEVAIHCAWQLRSEDAERIADRLSDEELGENGRDLLGLRAGQADAMAAGERLLASSSSPESGTVMETLVFGSWLASDAALDGRFSRAIEPRFQARAADPERFWSALGGRLWDASDVELAAGVIPLLERSLGESSSARLAVVRAVEGRFPGTRLR